MQGDAISVMHALESLACQPSASSMLKNVRAAQNDSCLSGASWLDLSPGESYVDKKTLAEDWHLPGQPHSCTQV